MAALKSGAQSLYTSLEPENFSHAKHFYIYIFLRKHIFAQKGEGTFTDLFFPSTSSIEEKYIGCHDSVGDVAEGFRLTSSMIP